METATCSWERAAQGGGPGGRSPLFELVCPRLTAAGLVVAMRYLENMGIDPDASWREQDEAERLMGGVGGEGVEAWHGWMRESGRAWLGVPGDPRRRRRFAPEKDDALRDDLEILYEPGFVVDSCKIGHRQLRSEISSSMRISGCCKHDDGRHALRAYVRLVLSRLCEGEVELTDGEGSGGKWY